MRPEPLILDAALGLVLAWPPAERVTILGKGSSNASVPVHEGEVWVVNTPSPSRAMPYASRGFQIHDLEQCDEGERAWVREERTIPLYVRDTPPRKGLGPMAVRYPMEAVRDRFGPDVPFTSSFDYMMGIACWEGFRSITLAGIEYQRGGSLRERLVEHCGLNFWVGLARGLGARVRVVGGACHFPYAYGGFDGDGQFYEEAEWAREQIRMAVLASLRVDEGYNAPDKFWAWHRTHQTRG